MLSPFSQSREWELGCLRAVERPEAKIPPPQGHREVGGKNIAEKDRMGEEKKGGKRGEGRMGGRMSEA